MVHQLAWMGAEAILQLTLTGTSDRDAEVVVARANAIVNQVHVVNVNAASPVGNGRLWEQLDAHGGDLELPMYDVGRYRPRKEG